MKKIFLVLAILLSTFFISCTKIPFTPKKPENNAALVYVYAGEAPSDTERITKYKVYINAKSTNGFIKDNEYTTYDMKAVSIRIAGSRNDIERHAIELELQAGQTYYFKLESVSDDFGKFNFTQVDASQALEELQETTLAGAYDTSQSVIGALILPNENKNEELLNKAKTATGMSAEELEAMIDAKVAEKTANGVSNIKTSTSITGSKLDDIKSAYEMKKQGLLTEAEFLKMKSEILAK